MIDVSGAAAPTHEWLGERVPTLWQPAELPPGLKHAETRRFLSEVGFPLVDNEWFESMSLADKGLWEADPDELFGRARPGDETPPATFAYGLGEYGGDFTLMADGETGLVEIYMLSGWDHGEGHQGVAFASVAEAAGSVALLTALDARLHGDDADAAVRELLAAVQETPWADSGYWAWAREVLEEEYAG